jgi:Mycoplasma protein of unknown function, DUF285
MSNMFGGASVFVVIGLAQWNPISVKNMQGMFAGALKFDTVVSCWDVHNVIDMSNTWLSLKM